MEALLNVILPVFLVVGSGYISVWRHWLSTENINSLTRFAQNLPFPVCYFMLLRKLKLAKILV